MYLRVAFLMLATSNTQSNSPAADSHCATGSHNTEEPSTGFENSYSMDKVSLWLPGSGILSKSELLRMKLAGRSRLS